MEGKVSRRMVGYGEEWWDMVRNGGVLCGW